MGFCGREERESLSFDIESLTERRKITKLNIEIETTPKIKS